MKHLNEKPHIRNKFKEENFIPQKIYQANKKYIPIYINKELFEELFEIEYEEEKAFSLISELFSLTLDKNKSNGKELGLGYADCQEDPMGISLSGNKGSGRAFFYGDCFNIKGDKTTLATSSKEIYSNGKFSLAAAIKETIITNILTKELSIPSFETLAILDTTDTYEFTSESLLPDDTIETEKYTLPTALEIRVNKDKELYRISNAFINKDSYTLKEIKDLSNKLTKIEAEKFINRFIHGSWSVGNISVNANLIDFDTAAFVKGRCPQYTNTNKYKSNYFGFELLGAKEIIRLLFENSYQGKKEELTKLLEDMDNDYNNYLKKEFVNIIGLDYHTYYKKYQRLLDELFNKFNKLSRQLLPNYYELNAYGINTDNTFIYDFSNFFQNYLINKNNDQTDLLYGLNLLLNETKRIEYKKVGFVKDKINEFFSDYLITEESKNLIEGTNFIKLYDELFNEIKKQTDLKEIMFKQYLLNMNRMPLNFNNYLTYLYYEKNYSSSSLNKIIDSVIKTNIRIYNENQKEYYCNLTLYKKYLTYLVLAKDYYYYILIPYKKNHIHFAKLILNEEEYMFHHQDDYLISDKIKYNELKEINVLEPIILVNGKKNKRIII